MSTATAVQLQAAQKAAEPSMEEILASIRRIIADDQKTLAAKAEAVAPVVQAAPVAQPLQVVEVPAVVEEISDNDDEISESGSYGAASSPSQDEPLLRMEVPVTAVTGGTEATTAVTELVSVVERVPQPAMITVSPEPVQASSPMIAQPVFQPQQYAAPAYQPAPVAYQPVYTTPEPIAQPQLLSSASATAASAAFQHLSQVAPAQTPRTLDEIAQEMLRPMLKNWLDENLPSLVERLVKAEIERVARGGR